MTTTTPSASRRRQNGAKASELAIAARQIAREAGLTSAYSSGEAAEVLRRFKAERASGGFVLIKKGTADPVRIRTRVLRAFVAGDQREDASVREVAATVRHLSHGLRTMLYGRKLAAFLLALSEQSR